MNTCQAPHLEMSPKCFTMATIVLFSASEPADCTLVVCDSEWVSAALNSAFLISTFCCYMAGAMWNCCHLGASSLCTIQPCITGRSWHKYLFCHDKHMLVMSKHVFCCDKSMLVMTEDFVTTNICCNKHFVATSILLSWQKYACHKKTFVSWQNYVFVSDRYCRDKRHVLLQQTQVCHDKNCTCVQLTPASDSLQPHFIQRHIGRVQGPLLYDHCEEQAEVSIKRLVRGQEFT